jgi:hypothetical protein
MTDTAATLTDLIQSSRIFGAADDCMRGRHTWEAEGGRGCPQEREGCSQAVYRCTVCGGYDYGEPGGPGAADCRQFCGDDASPIKENVS